MNVINYQKQLDALLLQVEKEEKVPTLLMHSCCAPCSSYCISYLAQYMKITIYYYNPNITEETEYKKRVEEQKRLIRSLPVKYPVDFVEGPYEPQEFYKIAKGYETCKEGGERCFACYRLRLRQSVQYASSHGYDYITTTLSVSPHKNAQKLNEIGMKLAEEIGGTTYLCSDFKKKGGYQKSVELSKEYDLYRQSYCGCVYSKIQAQNEGRV